MRINVKFFAVLKEKTGVDSTTIKITGAGTLNDLKKILIKKFGRSINLDKSIAFAVNGSIVKHNVKLNDNDEVAVLPPVSGGK